MKHVKEEFDKFFMQMRKEESSIIVYFRDKEIEISFNSRTQWEFIGDTFLKIIENYVDSDTKKLNTCVYYFRLSSVDAITEA